jgi:hypothetical protein
LEVDRLRVDVVQSFEQAFLGYQASFPLWRQLALFDASLISP